MKLTEDEVTGMALQSFSVANYLKHYRGVLEEQKIMTQEELKAIPES